MPVVFTKTSFVTFSPILPPSRRFSKPHVLQQTLQMIDAMSKNSPITSALIPKSARIAVLGAGAAGLQAAVQLRDAEYNVEVFEKSEYVGGLWRYSTESTSTSPIYASLRTNIVKQVMTFGDDYYASNIPTYLSHSHVYDYLVNFAERHNLHSFISFNTHVISIRKSNNKWLVTTNKSSQLFDAVMVCVGHYSKPRHWEVEGIEYLNKNGIEVKHSINYKVPDNYKDKVVMVIGSGPSGIDITLDVSKVANRVYMSHSNAGKRLKLHRPNNVSEVNRVKRILPNGKLVLENTNEEVSVDSIISCTGYRRDYPFLKQGEAGVHIKLDDRNVTGLVRQCISRQDATISFIGLPVKILPFPTFEAQIAFHIAVLQGRVSLEKTKEMGKEDDKSRDEKDKDYHVLGKQQWSYIIELSKLTGKPRIMDSLVEMGEHSTKMRGADPVRYREEELKLLGDAKGQWTKLASDPE